MAIERDRLSDEIPRQDFGTSTSPLVMPLLLAAAVALAALFMFYPRTTGITSTAPIAQERINIPTPNNPIVVPNAPPTPPATPSRP